MAFAELDDSPMFQKQVNCIEQVADDLKDRCQRLHKGCKKYMTVLEEACYGDTAFADCLEAFGGGQDDPVSMSIGGPVISKFISALRELASYKELLRSQVEHVLVERVMNFINIDLQDAKESRKRFDKAAYAYDQAREKFGSLKKNAREEIVSELEEDLQNSKSAFDRSRFNLVNGLMNVDSKKKYEFLESFSAIMDAHLRFFKLGYDLLSQMEPFIHQVLTYAQQSKEVANMEQDKLAKRIQEFRTQAELDTLHASENIEDSVVADGHHVAGLNSFKNIETIMQSTGKGEILTIKQGYLVKRSSSRSEWKRRFFVLDSRGALYYYEGIKPFGSHSHNSIGSLENNSGMFGRFRSRHQKSSSFGEAKLAYHTIDLHTSTIKIDAEDSDLHLCFRIISPLKTYTLQAENAVDRADWISKIKGVIASLLHSHILQQPNPGRNQLEYSIKGGSFPNLELFDKQNVWDEGRVDEADSVSQILREVPGNDICAECGAPQPDWASLNLGMLLCIECSGVHRNLGVHVSKVRSIFLDVKVWEPTILDLFRALGNAYCNSIWEELILQKDGRSSMKPCHTDTISRKEKYIHAKYVDKVLVNKEASLSSSNARSIWEAVKANNLRVVYRLIVASDIGLINTTYDEVHSGDQYHEVNEVDPTTCQRIRNPSEAEHCFQGCSILHLACHSGNPVMVELLLQFGANINVRDFHGRTPLHHCLSKGNNSLAKYLLRRGARPSLKDGGGKSVLERVMETGAISDEELFILLTGSE